MRVGSHLDQLRGNAHPLARLAHAAFENGRYVQLLRHRRDVDLRALEAERRGARGDPQAANLREHVEQLFRKAVGEIFVFLVAAHVHEGQHGDRWHVLVDRREQRLQGRERLR